MGSSKAFAGCQCGPLPSMFGTMRTASGVVACSGSPASHFELSAICIQDKAPGSRYVVLPKANCQVDSVPCVASSRGHLRWRAYLRAGHLLKMERALGELLLASWALVALSVAPPYEQLPQPPPQISPAVPPPPICPSFTPGGQSIPPPPSSIWGPFLR